MTEKKLLSRVNLGPNPLGRRSDHKTDAGPWLGPTLSAMLRQLF